MVIQSDQQQENRNNIGTRVNQEQNKAATSCPNCQTFFRITQYQLDEMKGQVCCGLCATTFNAFDHLLRIDQVSEFFDHDDTVLNKTELVLNTDFDEQHHVGHLSTNRKSLVIGWSLASFFLLASIALPYGYFKRDRLMQYSVLRPGFEMMCELTGCQLALPQDITQMILTQTNIRTHPSKPHTLYMEAAIVNRSSVPQAYPVVQVDLYDIETNVISSYKFPPQEYLDSARNIEDGLVAKSELIVTLDISAEQSTAVGFIVRLNKT